MSDPRRHTTTGRQEMEPAVEAVENLIAGRLDIVDLNWRYARVTGVRRGQFVEFEYVLGDPVLSIELIMPYLAFHEFCVDNKVEILPPETRIRADYEKLKWRFGVYSKARLGVGDVMVDWGDKR